MQRFSFLFIVSLLTGLSAWASPAQGVLDRSGVDVAGFVPEEGRLFHVDHGEEVWSRGADYKVRFGGESVDFFPFLGADAERHYPLALGAAKVLRGGAQVAALAPTKAERAGDEVIYDRGDWQERYTLRSEGMEQWFTIQRAPGEGDLVLRMEVGQETEWHVTPRNGGLRFANERGGVDYGAAKAFDAQRRNLHAQVDFVNGAIEITVPAESLNETSWPIMVDPLISTFTLDTYGPYLNFPDVAYDLTTDSVMVVYEEQFTVTDRDIYFRQYHSDSQAVLNNGYLSINTDDWSRPRVANNNFADAFLVVFEIDFGSYRNIGTRTISALDGTLSPIRGIDDTEFVENYHPDVGGEIVNSSASYFLVTYVQDDFNGTNKVMCTRIGTDGISLFEETILHLEVTHKSHDPAVSNTAGVEGVWNLIWGTHLGGNVDVHGGQVRWDGTLVHQNFHIDELPSGTLMVSRPSVSSSLDFGNPGSDRNYIATYITSTPGSPAGGGETIYVVSMAGSQVQDSTTLAPNFETFYNSSARADSDGQRFIVTWNTGTAGGSQIQAVVSTFSSSEYLICESEIRTPLESSTADPSGNPSVVTEYSGGGPRGTAHLAWARTPVSPTNFDIRSGRFQITADDCLGHIETCIPGVNSTGQSARLWSYGSHAASDDLLQLYADRMPPNQFGYFVTGTGTGDVLIPGSQGRFCLGGTLGRFNRNAAEILYSGSSGTFQLDIGTQNMPTASIPTILPGTTWYFQAWHRDLNPGSTSNFTTLLSVLFE